MENGLYQNLPEQEYHAIDRLSWSKVKHTLACPAKAKYEAERVREASAAMVRGSLVDVLTFTPDAFDSLFVVGAEKPKRRSGEVVDVLLAGGKPEVVDGKTVSRAVAAEAKAAGTVACTQDDLDEAQAFIDATKGRTAVSRDEYAMCVKGAQVVTMELNRVFGGSWREYAIPQPSLLATLRGVDTKARFDLIVPGVLGEGAAIVDLKVTSRIAQFATHAADFGWYGQLANYEQTYDALFDDGVRDVFIIALQLEPWVECRCAPLTERTRKFAHARCDRAWETYLAALDADRWDGYTANVEAWDAPDWLMRREGA